MANECDGDFANQVISPDAAAFLMTTCGVIGGAIAMPLVTWALAALGFTAVGVAGGSVAATWQSLIGNVIKGSLFAILQSIAMGGTGAAATVTIGGMIGANVTDPNVLAGWHLVARLCAMIDDEVRKGTAIGTLIQANTLAVQKENGKHKL